MTEPPLYFVERLTFWVWLRFVWPRALKTRLKFGHGSTPVYFVDAPRITFVICRWSALLTGVTLQRFVFRTSDIHEESGLSTRLKIFYDDLLKVERESLKDPLFRDIYSVVSPSRHLSTFLSKRIASTVPYDRTTIWRALSLINACDWKRRQEEAGSRPLILFLERRPWDEQINRYAGELSLTTISVSRSRDYRAELRRRLPAKIVNKLRGLRYRRLRKISVGRFTAGNVPTSGEPKHGSSIESLQDSLSSSHPAKVAVEFYGMLNLAHPERQSDLFFWQNSDLSGNDILLTFSIPAYPLDEQRKSELEQHGMNAIVLHPGATSIASEPVLSKVESRSFRTNPIRASRKENELKADWINTQFNAYQETTEYWRGLCESSDVKVFVTWSKYDAVHCAIANAVESTGGVTAVYQRGYEGLPSPQFTVDADVVFGYSTQNAEIVGQCDSYIKYHVATGFLGDHRAPLLAKSASKVRKQLLKNGAHKILAYLDENSASDARWSSGNDIPQRDYGSLLERVIDDPEFGLLLKPKAVGTLRSRLGPVASLLEKAEATGRCKVYQDRDPGGLHGWSPPVEAALAADVCVHGYLSAATAGIETALAGVPTLLLDLESWPVSPLYELGVGKVVFNSWDDLWDACSQQWSSGPKIPGFGDWEPVLDQLDSFRDGRAAERMGNYINWLISGFKDGKDRETVLAEAAERYCAHWGQDKICNVSGPLVQPVFADTRNGLPGDHSGHLTPSGLPAERQRTIG